MLPLIIIIKVTAKYINNIANGDNSTTSVLRTNLNTPLKPKHGYLLVCIMIRSQFEEITQNLNNNGVPVKLCTSPLDPKIFQKMRKLIKTSTIKSRPFLSKN
mmetsp:Transcript_5253/g.5775  ORF Transcript_5253/g.5775 Transcript_5253/m.5775 type:complete len:102 (-) Transcript_5253:829-1134(-)